MKIGIKWINSRGHTLVNYAIDEAEAKSENVKTLDELDEFLRKERGEYEGEDGGGIAFGEKRSHMLVDKVTKTHVVDVQQLEALGEEVDLYLMPNFAGG